MMGISWAAFARVNPVKVCRIEKESSVKKTVEKPEEGQVVRLKRAEITGVVEKVVGPDTVLVRWPGRNRLYQHRWHFLVTMPKDAESKAKEDFL